MTKQRAPEDERPGRRGAETDDEAHRLRHLVGSEVLDERGSRGEFHRAMHEAVRSPDDDVREHRMAPGQEEPTCFAADPAAADAAADLAADLGREYLDSATGDVDIGEIADRPSDDELGGPFILEEPGAFGEDSGELPRSVEARRETPTGGPKVRESVKKIRG